MVRTLLLMGLVAALCAGCGKKTTTIPTPDGSVTVTEGRGGDVSATVETPEGTATMEGNSDKGEWTVKGPDGEVKVQSEGDGGTVRVEADGGKSEYQTGDNVAIDEEALGLPVFPGATGTLQTDSTNADGSKSRMVQLKTDKPAKEAYAFYKDKLGEPLASDTSMTAPNGDQMYMLNTEGDVSFAVAVTSSGDDGTTITITRIERGKN